MVRRERKHAVMTESVEEGSGSKDNAWRKFVVSLEVQGTIELKWML